MTRGQKPVLTANQVEFKAQGEFDEQGFKPITLVDSTANGWSNELSLSVGIYLIRGMSARS